MRFVALMLAVAMLGAGIGLASVAPVQAHGGDGGSDQVEVTPAYSTCPVVLNVENVDASFASCGGGGRG